MFLGTPHRGVRDANWSQLVLKAVAVVGLNKSIVDMLNPRTEKYCEDSKDWGVLYHKLHNPVICFAEQFQTKLPWKLRVLKMSRKAMVWPRFCIWCFRSSKTRWLGKPKLLG